MKIGVSSIDQSCTLILDKEAHERITKVLQDSNPVMYLHWAHENTWCWKKSGRDDPRCTFSHSETTFEGKDLTKIAQTATTLRGEQYDKFNRIWLDIDEDVRLSRDQIIITLPPQSRRPPYIKKARKTKEQLQIERDEQSRHDAMPEQLHAIQKAFETIESEMERLTELGWIFTEFEKPEAIPPKPTPIQL